MDERRGTEPIPAGIRTAAEYLPELESLRGVAIALVVAYHLDAFVRLPAGRDEVVSPLFAFVRAGHTGVDLFFVLSGFLLSLPFLAAVGDGRGVNVRRYYARRALRILPLYWVAVVVGTVMTATRPADLLRGLPSLCFLNALPAFVPNALSPYSNTWWSLATEVQFYLLLPLLALASSSRAGRIAGATLLAVHACAYGAFLLRAFVMRSREAEILLALSLFGRMPHFLFGIGAAWLYQRRGARVRRALARRTWLRWGGADALLLGLLVGFGVFLRYAVMYGAGENPPVQAWHTVAAAVWAIVLLTVLMAPLRVRPLLQSRVLRRLGVLSYSIYLIHVPLMLPAIQTLQHRWPAYFPVAWSLPAMVAATTLSLACLVLASLTYESIERPFLERKSRIGT